MRREALALAKRPLRRLRDYRLAHRYGADFSESLILAEFGFGSASRQNYIPSHWPSTARAFRRLRLGPPDVVADLGAGKGLAVLLAAEHPVQRVIGVELVPEIAEIARKNVERNRGRLRAGAVDIVVCDALNWPIPDDLSVVYLFSPFLDEIFHGVLERLIESIDRAPRPVRLVYSYPREHAQILRTGRARVLDVIPPGRPNRRGWWKAEFLIVTYGLGDWPYPPPRGREAPSAAVRWWSDP